MYRLGVVVVLVLFLLVGGAVAEVPDEATGEGVKVGVIDFGFEGSDEILGDNVQNEASFGETSFDSSTHGTAVAEVVLGDAPQSDLYLASVSASGDDSFGEAVDWMIAEDVDIIVVSLATYGQPYDGEGAISQAISDARAQGIITTAAAGNAAESHWVGNFTDNDPIEFVEGQSRNHIIQDSTEPVHIRFSKEDWSDARTTSQSYEMEIYDGDQMIDSIVLTGEDAVVGTSIVGDDLSFEIKRDGIDREDVPIEVFGFGVDNPDFEYYTQNGSIVSPATSPDSLAIGAWGNGELRSFSSHGPTPDGRIGVDVVAPDGQILESYDEEFIGTSGAAPNVAGSLAALASYDPNLNATDKERVLRQTASHADNPTVATGYGVYDHNALFTAYDFQLRNITVDNNSTSFNAHNNGTVKAHEEVFLRVDGSPIANSTISLAGGESQNVTLDEEISLYGNRTIGLGSHVEEMTITPQIDDITIAHSDELKYTIKEYNTSAVTNGEVLRMDVEVHSGEYSIQLSNLDPNRVYYVSNPSSTKEYVSSSSGELTLTKDIEGELVIEVGHKAGGGQTDSSDGVLLAFSVVSLLVGVGYFRVVSEV